MRQFLRFFLRSPGSASMSHGGAYVYCTSQPVGKTPTWGGNFGKERRQCVTAPESDGERGTSCGCVSGVGFTNHPHYNAFYAGSSVKRSRPAISGHNGGYVLPEKAIPMIQIVPQTSVLYHRYWRTGPPLPRKRAGAFLP